MVQLGVAEGCGHLAGAAFGRGRALHLGDMPLGISERAFDVVRRGVTWGLRRCRSSRNMMLWPQLNRFCCFFMSFYFQFRELFHYSIPSHASGIFCSYPCGVVCVLFCLVGGACAGVVQAGRGNTWSSAAAADGSGNGVGLWEELKPAREAWLERGPCMGRGRLRAVLSEEGLATALLWRTETTEIEKVP